MHHWLGKISLPFGWKVSPFIYHTTGLFATGFFRSIGIPCLLYIDDRHNGQLQVSFEKGEYGALATADERNSAAAKSVIFLIALDSWQTLQEKCFI